MKDKSHNGKVSGLISLLSIIILFPSILLTKKKWEKERLKERAENYIKSIKENHSELAIISYEAFKENDKNFLRITLLNDSVAISKSRLDAHNDLVKDIHLIWQYSPAVRSTGESEMLRLQSQITALKDEIDRIKSQKKIK